MISEGRPGGLRPASRQTLAGQVYDQILVAICSGALPPGRKLVIDQLARDLGVSITPVREALRQLQREGLVTEVPYAGMQVTSLSVDELRQLFAVRGVLEGYAVRLAAERLTEADLTAIEAELEALEAATAAGHVATFRAHNTRFHEAILARAGSAPLAELIVQLTRNTERYRAAGGVLDRPYLEAAQAEHRQLVALLRARQAEAAEALARDHALTFADHLARRLEAAR